MNASELCFPGHDAARMRGPMRWELFQHRHVRDVRLTSDADTLRIIHQGPARPADWATTLTDAGFPAPVHGGSPGPVSSARDLAA